VRPLTFVVNQASGGRRGSWLLKHLRLRLPSQRIHELPGVDLGAVAAAASEDGSAIIACGGDGTAAACLEASWRPGDRPMAPVGVIPLGTGNDLARHLGWGGRAADAASLDGLLVRLQNARTSAHDRWVVEGPSGAIAWFNYLSIGTDARIAMRFHRLRRHHPSLFRSPAVNRLLYAGLALSETQRPLAGRLVLPGSHLPDWTRAVVFANIPSYAGGVALGEDIHPVDGHLGGFVLGPGAALGLAAGGVRRPHSLGSHAQVDFILTQALVMQIDGEPSLAPPGRYCLRRVGMVRVLVAR
jgi:diacylglycerol kinase (ATP)